MALSPRFWHIRGHLLGLLLLLPSSLSWAQRPVIQRIHATADAHQDSVFQLGSTITLEVSGLGRWIRQQEGLLQSRFGPQNAHAKARDLVLYVDDAPLLNMPPLAVYANETRRLAPAAPPPPAAVPSARDSSAALVAVAAPAQVAADSALAYALDALPTGTPDKVIFQLRRTVDNARYWNVVYKSPWDFSHPSHIGLGYADQVFTDLYPTQKGRPIRLELVQLSALWLAGIGVVAMAVGLLVLALRSWLLRETNGDDGSDPDDAPLAISITNPPYSLARVQLAWWTFIILGSYLVIYAVTGVLPDISTTSLALLGISASTMALSGLTTSGQGASAAASAGQGPSTAGSPPQQSRGLLTDMVSDEHGVCIHRLQKVIIALLMGCFFVRAVYDTVAMPVWTTNQTLLLAISSATYLGLKWQENRMAAAAMPLAPGNALAVPVGDNLGPAAPTWPALDGLPATGLAVQPAVSAASLTTTATTESTQYAALSVGSLADPVTGAVLRRVEDDMGPPNPATGYVPSEQATEQAAG